MQRCSSFVSPWPAGCRDQRFPQDSGVRVIQGPQPPPGLGHTKSQEPLTILHLSQSVLIEVWRSLDFHTRSAVAAADCTSQGCACSHYASVKVRWSKAQLSIKTSVCQLTRQQCAAADWAVGSPQASCRSATCLRRAYQRQNCHQLDCCRQEIAPLVSKTFAELAEGPSPAWERCQVNLKDRKAHSNPYLPTPITRWINVLAWWVDSMPAWLPGTQHSA